MSTPVYDKRSRYPLIVEKGKCRGCQTAVPKGRQTWCSNTCYARHYWPIVCREVFKRDAGICQICFVKVARWECDHIVPFSEGGLSVVENCRVLCVPCHKKRTAEHRRSKKTKTPAVNRGAN